jgi:hypothetical protein
MSDLARDYLHDVAATQIEIAFQPIVAIRAMDKRVTALARRDRAAIAESADVR